MQVQPKIQHTANGVFGGRRPLEARSSDGRVTVGSSSTGSLRRKLKLLLRRLPAASPAEPPPAAAATLPKEKLPLRRLRLGPSKASTGDACAACTSAAASSSTSSTAALMP